MCRHQPRNNSTRAAQSSRSFRRWPPLASFTWLLFFGVGVHAQPQPAPAARAVSLPGGTVSGQVVLGDTRQPGRFATVLLLSAENLPLRLGRQNGSRTYTATTNLAGEYSVQQVEPGEYYVVASAPGYLSVYSFDGNQDQAKLRAALDRMAVRVSVQANGSSRADLELVRGATVAGQVHYDDGSPAAGLQIVILTREEANAAWHEVPVLGFGRVNLTLTDEEGRWRRAGLAAGLYTAAALLPSLQSTGSGAPGANHSRFGVDASGNLTVYLGGGSDSTRARAVTVRAGEQVTGLEIAIPTQGLSHVEGTVFATETGQSLAGLNLYLQLADGGEFSRRMATSGEDGRFAFSNVPSGMYKLRLEGGIGSNGIGNNKVVYKPVEQTIEVNGSVRDLVVQAAAR